MSHILQALHDHLQQHTPYNWEHTTTHDTIQATITQNTHITAIITIEHNPTKNTLRISKITETATPIHIITHNNTIDLLDPEFLHKIHQIVGGTAP